jgi:hypothetical protein
MPVTFSSHDLPGDYLARPWRAPLGPSKWCSRRRDMRHRHGRRSLGPRRTAAGSHPRREARRYAWYEYESGTANATGTPSASGTASASPSGTATAPGMGDRARHGRPRPTWASAPDNAGRSRSGGAHPRAPPLIGDQTAIEPIAVDDGLECLPWAPRRLPPGTTARSLDPTPPSVWLFGGYRAAGATASDIRRRSDAGRPEWSVPRETPRVMDCAVRTAENRGAWENRGA